MLAIFPKNGVQFSVIHRCGKVKGLIFSGFFTFSTVFFTENPVKSENHLYLSIPSGRFFHSTVSRSMERYWMASAVWAAEMHSSPARSAMVRATFSIRS